MKKLIFIFLVLALCLPFAVSCGAEQEVVYNGTVLSESDVLQILDQLRSESEAETETEPESESQLQEAYDGLVYWTDGGSVWHALATCGHISKKQEPKCGSVEDAIEAGKERGCSFCVK